MTDISKAELRRQIREVGAPAAYRALLRVLEDPKASSTALSSAARTMMDLTGFMKEADAPPKEAHEMSYAELNVTLRQGIERDRELLDAREENLRAFEQYLNAAYDDLNQQLVIAGKPPLQGAFESVFD